MSNDPNYNIALDLAHNFFMFRDFEKHNVNREKLKSILNKAFTSNEAVLSNIKNVLISTNVEKNTMKYYTKKEMYIFIDLIISRAVWLDDYIIESWIKGVDRAKIRNFLKLFYTYYMQKYESSSEDKKISAQKIFIKHMGVLLSIPYAELKQDLDGELYNFIYEILMFAKDIIGKYSISSSMTIWQVPVPRLKELVKDKKSSVSQDYVDKFYRTRDPIMALNLMSKIVFYELNISTDLDGLFTNYNRQNKETARNVILQVILNSLRAVIIFYIDEEQKEINLIDSFKNNILKQDKNIQISENEITNMVEWLEAHNNNYKSSKNEDLMDNLKKIIESDINIKQNLSNEWPILTIDGSYGNSVKNALIACQKYFGIFDSTMIQKINNFNKDSGLDIEIENLRNDLLGDKLNEMNMVPINNNKDSKKKDALLVEEFVKILKEKTKHLNNQNISDQQKTDFVLASLEDLIINQNTRLKQYGAINMDILNVFLKERNLNIQQYSQLNDSDKINHLVNFFRFKLQNPSDTAKYVYDGLTAFSILLHDYYYFSDLMKGVSEEILERIRKDLNKVITNQ
jgi:hypothetical protein